MNYLHFYLTFLFVISQDYVHCTESTTPGLRGTSPYPGLFPDPTDIMDTNDVSASSMNSIVSKSPENDTNEIIATLYSILKKEDVSWERMLIENDSEVPEFSTSINNHTVTFLNMSMDYEVDDETDTDFIEFKCSDYLQVNISKYLRVLKINGSISISAASSASSNHFSLSLRNVLISGIRRVHVMMGNEIVHFDEPADHTNLKYENIKPDLDADEDYAPIILSTIPLLLTHLKSHLHQVIDSIIEWDSPVPADFQCLPDSGIAAHSTLSNKKYVIDGAYVERAETHTVSIGPAIINGFSNITQITWKYSYSPYNGVSRRIVMNVGSLYAKSNWNITASQNNVYSSKGTFKVNNIQLIHFCQELNPYRYSFNIEVETSVHDESYSVIDDILCKNLDKLISTSLLYSLYA